MLCLLQNTYPEICNDGECETYVKQEANRPTIPDAAKSEGNYIKRIP